MSDLMTFPNTVEEFMEQYKVIDTEQVYTNGVELVPIFRMKQWFEHLSTSEPRNKVFEEIVVKYPDPDTCIYQEYKGKPYYSIRYQEDG